MREEGKIPVKKIAQLFFFISDKNIEVLNKLTFVPLSLK